MAFALYWASEQIMLPLRRRGSLSQASYPLPELAVTVSWPVSVLLFAAGYGLLLGVNRYVYPVCPTCAHDHDHNACPQELHGFAGPLIAAAACVSETPGFRRSKRLAAQTTPSRRSPRIRKPAMRIATTGPMRSWDGSSASETRTDGEKSGRKREPK